jgi:hypothetical protein
MSKIMCMSRIDQNTDRLGSRRLNQRQPRLIE